MVTHGASGNTDTMTRAPNVRNVIPARFWTDDEQQAFDDADRAEADAIEEALLDDLFLCWESMQDAEVSS